MPGGHEMLPCGGKLQLGSLRFSSADSQSLPNGPAIASSTVLTISPAIPIKAAKADSAAGYLQVNLYCPSTAAFKHHQAWCHDQERPSKCHGNPFLSPL